MSVTGEVYPRYDRYTYCISNLPRELLQSAVLLSTSQTSLPQILLLSTTTTSSSSTPPPRLLLSASYYYFLFAVLLSVSFLV